MPIVIKELIIKVRIEEPENLDSSQHLDELKRSLMKACKKEISRQMKKNKER